AALTLAKTLAARAQHGERLGELAHKFSDHSEHIRHGTLGVWRTTEPGFNGLVVEALQGLKMGQISDPIDSTWGFQIVQRTPPEVGAEYAARVVELFYRGDVPDGDARSEGHVRALADDL